MPYCLNRGTDQQISEQVRLLENHGICIVNQCSEPELANKEDYMRSLTKMFRYRISGWWFYGDELVRYKICTDQDIIRALNKENRQRGLASNEAAPLPDLRSKAP
ncbi:MAG: hypothetical protein E6713_02805 [Sporomusaceae bacterium]|nr:hypothetical protein [Sporomusaceae bacterium]